MRRTAAQLSRRTLRFAGCAATWLASSSAAAPLTSSTATIAPCRAFSVTPVRRVNGSGGGVSSNAGPGGAASMVGGDVDDLEETHPDFQPRMVASDLAEDEIAAIKKDISETIRDEEIVVFIKGVPEAPMCAFSKKMIDVMEALGVEYTSFDVLAHPVVRTYVKELSEWPTIPQVFLKGEFAGGVDIVLKMAENGDLQLLLDQKGIKHRDTK